MIKSLADVSKLVSSEISKVKMFVYVRRSHVFEDTLRAMQRSVFSPDKNFKVSSYF